MASNSITQGFKLNHVGLRVADIDKSIDFYSGVFGMRELARMPLDTVTIVFLGYASKNDSFASVFAREGVLELVAPKVSSNPTCMGVKNADH